MDFHWLTEKHPIKYSPKDPDSFGDMTKSRSRHTEDLRQRRQGDDGGQVHEVGRWKRAGILGWMNIVSTRSGGRAITISVDIDGWYAIIILWIQTILSLIIHRKHRYAQFMYYSIYIHNKCRKTDFFIIEIVSIYEEAKHTRQNTRGKAHRAIKHTRQSTLSTQDNKHKTTQAKQNSYDLV